MRRFFIKIRYLYPTVFLFLINFFTVFAQRNNLTFSHLSPEDGLSNSIVTAIVQGNQGFMWIGTKDGLNRFDGYSFIHFQHNSKDSSSISNNNINVLYKDSKGNLWIGTSNGLNKLNYDKNNFTRYTNHPDHNSISDNQILSIFEDRKGILWIGTYKGLNKFDPRSGSFTLFEIVPGHSDKWVHNTIKAIYEDKEGNLWVGTSKGIHHFNRETNRFASYPHSKNGSINHPVNCILEDKWGTLWIGTSDAGLKTFDRNTKTYKTFEKDPSKNSISDNTVFTLLEDSFGDLWIGTQNGGLNRYNRQSGFTHFTFQKDNPSSISNNTILTIYEDRFKVLWFGTWYGGLNKADLLQKKIYHYKTRSDESNNWGQVVYSIMDDEAGLVYIGVKAGFEVWNRQTEKVTKLSYGPDRDHNKNTVYHIIKDKDQNIWFGLGGGGLVRSNPKTGEIKTFRHKYGNKNSLSHDIVNTLIQDSKGTIWVGTRYGLSRLSEDQEYFTNYKPADISTSRFNVSSILEDSSGFLWVATFDDGLFKFDPNDELFKTSGNTSKKSAEKQITRIFQDRKGNLWVALESGGLFLLDKKTLSLKPSNIPEELLQVSIQGILEDGKGNFWMSTQKSGIYKYNPQSHELANYNIDDGLQGNDFKAGSYKNNKGELYFGGRNGLNVFHPDSIFDNPYPPEVVITEFKVFDKPRKLSKDITLTYKDNFFSFDFAALSYAFPEKNEFAYILEGVDQDWIYSGRRRYASYTNIDPGEYTFKVKAANHDGLWNEKGRSLNITITPPIWDTKGAYFLYFILVIGLLYGLRHYTITRERLKNDLKFQQLESEKLQELDSLKSRFFANVSHELRTPLTLIKSPLERLLSEPLDGTQQKKYFQIMSRNTNRLLSIINQLLDLSKLEAGRMKLETSAGDIVSFIRDTVFSFTGIAESKEIDFQYNEQITESWVYFDNDKVEKILTNLLSNAFKFTPEKGVIKVNVFKTGTDDPKLVLEVEDSGIGIPKDKLEKIFDRFYQVDSSYTREYEGTGIGLALTKELAELHGGKIEVSSEEGLRTLFRVEIPFVEAMEDPEVKDFRKVKPENSSPNTYKSNNKPVNTPVTTINDQSPVLLVVDDSEDVCSYVTSIFEKDYRIFQARNGEEGLNIAIENIPDIIISDLMMPKIDGIQLCKKVKTDERTSHIPVILLTAKTAINSKLEGLETGADDYLSKPFNTDELQARVKNLVEQRRMLRERFSKELAQSKEPADSGSPSVPNLPSNTLDNSFLQTVIKIIESNLSDSDLGIERLEEEIAMSRVQLYRKIKAVTNQTPGELIRNYRLKTASVLLSKNDLTVSEIAFKVGFNNLSYFTKCFKEVFGCTPSEYLSNHKKR